MMEQQEAPWGVVVAMDPQTGAVLGMVSLPSYNNNIFAERIGEDYMELEADERRPLINYAIGGLYPPGSVFKMVPAAAALSEGVINRSTTIVDAGPIYLPNRYAPNNPELAQEFVSWNHKLGIVQAPSTWSRRLLCRTTSSSTSSAAGTRPRSSRGWDRLSYRNGPPALALAS